MYCPQLTSTACRFCVLCREVRLEKYLGRGKKILLVLIRQFSCLLCRLHLKDLEKNQVKTPVGRNHVYCSFNWLDGLNSKLNYLAKLPLDVTILHVLTHTWLSLSSLSSSVCDIIAQRSLDAHSIEAVVVSFGCQEGALHWLQETGCQYDMLLDPERKVRGQILTQH